MHNPVFMRCVLLTLLCYLLTPSTLAVTLNNEQVKQTAISEDVQKENDARGPNSGLVVAKAIIIPPPQVTELIVNLAYQEKYYWSITLNNGVGSFSVKVYFDYLPELTDADEGISYPELSGLMGGEILTGGIGDVKPGLYVRDGYSTPPFILYYFSVPQESYDFSSATAKSFRMTLHCNDSSQMILLRYNATDDQVVTPAGAGRVQPLSNHPEYILVQDVYWSSWPGLGTACTSGDTEDVLGADAVRISEPATMTDKCWPVTITNASLVAGPAACSMTVTMYYYYRTTIYPSALELWKDGHLKQRVNGTTVAENAVEYEFIKPLLTLDPFSLCLRKLTPINNVNDQIFCSHPYYGPSATIGCPSFQGRPVFLSQKIVFTMAR